MQVLVETPTCMQTPMFIQLQHQQPQSIIQQQAVFQTQPMVQQQPAVSLTISAPQGAYPGGIPAGQHIMDPTIAASFPVHMGRLVAQTTPAEQRSIFFAGVTPIIPSETLMALFSQFGPVQSINLFKPWAGSKTSKGCGIVSVLLSLLQLCAENNSHSIGHCTCCQQLVARCLNHRTKAQQLAGCTQWSAKHSHNVEFALLLAQVVFVDRASAAAALEALNGNFQWPGARSPMVVEWVDVNKQHKKARAQPLAYPMLQQLHQFVGFQPRPNVSMMMPGQAWNNAAGQQLLV